MQPNVFYINNNSQKYELSLLIKRKLLCCHLIIFKLLGLASWKVNIIKIFECENNRNNNPVLVETNSNYGYLINILLIVSLFTYFTILLILGLFSAANSKIVKIFELSYQFLGVITVIIVWVIYILYEKIIVNIVNTLKKIDNILKNCDCYKFENNYCMNISFLLNSLICTLFWLFGIFINVSIATPLWVIPSIISSWVLTQYALLLNNIYHRFKSINAMIIKLGNLSTEFELKTVFKSKTPLSKPIIRDITNINYVSMKLCQVCEDVENFYAIPTLLTSIYFIFSTIISLYLEISLINTSHIDLCAILIQISCSSWFSMVIINFITLVSNTVKTTREVSTVTLTI